ncbi:Retrovirus-related Pol polyprotein from transposon 17.6 [Araneus ventricosus]|uniref:RNA-directed DNA polymerase n=1 Tax=Araneus ventricosus TaxID=182803 RepID=A0A4Y2SIE0_ARAVE|nr:Retrovirus-related Pol polyprotein from transposon 17.6 [Araneus ventricosus]
MFPNGNSANSPSDDFSKQKLNSDQFLDNEKCDIERSSVNSITGRMVTKIQIPAFSQKYVEIKLDDNCNAFTVDQPILVESLNDKHSDSFLIARSVSNLNVKNRCVALICNLNDSPVNLNKNMALVKISPIHKVACIENVNINISDLGQCDLIKHEIHLSHQVPIRQKPYRVPYHLKPEMRSQINVLLEAGIIQPSTSSFSAPVILVKKSDGSYRLEADLRKLNAKTVPDNYPLPNLTEIIDNLSGSKFFSTLDLTSGFHQMVMHSDHTKYTAIATEFGLFEYKRLPFGLRNASASFQRLMNLVLAGLNEFQISCYIDDLVIAAENFDEHLAKLEMVFQRLQKANLKVKPSKCSFLKDQITYLGHTVREGQVYPDKKNLDSIREALPPKTKRQVRSFLGLTGFYRKFIPKYSEIALPLTELTKDCNGFKWTEMEQSAFEKLKLYLTSEPCLALPDFSKPFAVCSDASRLALGAVLVKEDETGFLLPIAFASRKLSKAETKFAVVELETMAIVFAVNHFKNYLFGKYFRINSDQQCLSKIIDYKDPTSRIARWMVTLHQFDYTVIHKPGRLNLTADYLSRASYPNDECVSEKQADVNTLDLEANIFSVNEIPNSEIIEKQNTDAYCCSIKDKLNSNFVFSPNLPKFFLKNNVLLCYTNSKDRHGSKAKLVAPQTLVQKIFNLTHDNDTVAHPGLARTLKRIKDNFLEGIVCTG